MNQIVSEVSIKKRLKNIVLNDITVTRDDVILEVVGVRKQKISLANLIGKQLQEITVASSIDLKKKDTTNWLSDGTSVADRKDEPRKISYDRYIGDTVISVGYYTSKLHGKSRVSVSLTTKFDPTDKDAKSKTIAFGMYVK